MKKLFRLLTITVLVALVFSGCKSSTKDVGNESKDKIQVPSLTQEFQDAVKSGDFEKFKGLFSESYRNSLKEEDFKKLKDINVDFTKEDSLYIYTAKDNSLIAIRIGKNAVDGKSYITEMTVIPEEIAGYVKEALNSKPFLTDNGTREEIENKLGSSMFVYGTEWSPDGSYAAFVRGETTSQYGQLYIWKVGEKEPELIESAKDRICEISWSPDSSYILVDTGTSPNRLGLVVSAKDFKLIDNLQYTGKTCWSPDSKWIALGMPGSVKPEEDNGWYNTDMVLYNPSTKEKKIIANATSDIHYYPKEWKKDGILTYERVSFSNKRTETLTYKYQK